MRRRGPARPGHAAAGDSASGAGTVAGTAATDGVILRARWGGVALTLVQLLLFVPSDGVSIPFPLWWGALPALMLVLINVVVVAGARSAVPTAWWHLGAVVGDSVALLLLIVIFAFDPSSALWTLMMLPVAEAALRGWPRRALAVYGALALGFVGLQWVAHAVWATPLPTADSLTYRIGFVGIMALILSGLSRRLQQQIASTAASQAEAEQLRAVATAARRMSDLDVATVVREVTGAAELMGFTQAQVWYREGTDHPDQAPGTSAPSLGGERFDAVAGATHGTGWVVLEGEDAPVRGGAGEVLVVAGITAGGAVQALLAARHASPLDESRADGLALLATQASAALTNARRYEEGRAFEARLAHQASHDGLTGSAQPRPARRPRPARARGAGGRRWSPRGAVPRPRPLQARERRARSRRRGRAAVPGGRAHPRSARYGRHLRPGGR